MIMFSVIIPAKNEAGMIGQCIRSINDKSNYPKNDFEIIIVDNGSSDNTVDIAQSEGAIVFVKPGLTISGLRNFGASISKGSILVFIDADCTVNPDWLKTARKYIERSDVVCFGSAPVIPEKPTWVQKTWFKVRTRGECVSEVRWLESMNMFVRKEIFQMINGFDESLVTCEDVDISYRLSKYGKIISDPSISVVHHGEADRVSVFFRKEKWRGKSNYKGLFVHGLKIDEIPSLVLPLWYGLFFLIFVTNFFLPLLLNSITFFLLWQLPPLSMTILKLRGKKDELVSYIQLYCIYNIYYSARFTSLFI